MVLSLMMDVFNMCKVVKSEREAQGRDVQVE